MPSTTLAVLRAQVCAQLQAAAQRTRCTSCTATAVSGGRRFLAALRHHRPARPDRAEFAGQRYLLSHGDLLCVDDVDYQRFRVQAAAPPGSNSFVATARYAPRRARIGIRQESEARKQSGAVYADVDSASAIAWLPGRRRAHTHPGHPPPACLWPLACARGAERLGRGRITPRLETLRLSATGLERVALGPM